FSRELAYIDPIPSRIEKADLDLEEEICFVENLLYDNSSPRPLEELNLEIADTILESLSPSPILIEDSDSLMEEIDLFLASNDSMPPGIEDDDYDSEGDIRFLEELLNNDSLPELESFHFDLYDDPLFSRPPPEPSDVCMRFKPILAMKNDFVKPNEDFHLSETVLSLNVEEVDSFTFLIWTFLPYFTYPEDSPLIFSFRSENFIFDPGIVTFHFSYLKPVAFLMEVFHICSP
ncbi:hypothetical protein Tco_1093973, partial [Tanacetum coccineum]